MTVEETYTLNHYGKPLRVITRDGEPWYVVADLCRILSIYIRKGKPAVAEAMRRLRPCAKGHCLIQSSCGPRLTAIVNSEGVNDMAFWAKHPDAPTPFVWDINEAMVSARPEPAALGG